jgi:CheY-like chemotaxis protein
VKPRETFDLNEVVRQAVETCRAEFAAGHHDLVVMLPRDAVEVAGDCARLTQAVTNLLTNAARLIAAGGRVEVTLETAADSAVLRVRAGGRGMDADTLGGVEAASGGVDSELVIRLPRAAAAPAQPRRALRVLVVDDNRDSADSAVLLLEIKGFDAHAAYDGEEAVRRACTLKPDVVLLDLNLPKKSGYEACREMRAAGLGEAFIVAVTGYDDADVRRRSAAAGCDGFHVKPIGATVIEQLLAPLAARKDARREIPANLEQRARTADAG